MAIPLTPPPTTVQKFSLLVNDVLRYNYTTPGEVRAKLHCLADECADKPGKVSYEALERMFVARIRRLSKPRISRWQVRRSPKVPIPTLIRREWALAA